VTLLVVAPQEELEILLRLDFHPRPRFTAVKTVRSCRVLGKPPPRECRLPGLGPSPSGLLQLLGHIKAGERSELSSSVAGLSGAVTRPSATGKELAGFGGSPWRTAMKNDASVVWPHGLSSTAP
jgi:hypothetical protein